MSRRLPAWAAWNPVAAEHPWTLGVEEEVMLVDATSGVLVPRVDEVLLALADELGGHAAAETHASVLELATHPQATVHEAVDELARLRAALAGGLDALGVQGAVAGTHPFARAGDSQVSEGARYQAIHESMRDLARREPTFALHVHVAVPTPEAAVRALDGLRAHLPVLLGVAANSPFWHGRDSGLAATRIPIFGGFPRTGLPRHFGSYAAYVEAVDVLLRCGAYPEPTFVWWDARLQPKFGTLEVRVMDAQTTVGDVGALVALVQCLVRALAEGDLHVDWAPDQPEVLLENRFLATRDGAEAELVDAGGERRLPLRDWLCDLTANLADHARDLGCVEELEAVDALAERPGAARQRELAGDPAPGSALDHAHLLAVLRGLQAAFVGEPLAVVGGD